MTLDLKKLSKKFPEEDIEWRIQMCGNNSWALVVPYITNRAIMQRLDDVCGIGGWKNEEPKPSPCGNGYLSGISIKIDDEWITKWDGSGFSGGGSIDKVKSTLSTSMKRTGVQWDIGRYLYQFEAAFADVKPCATRRDVEPGSGYIFHENKNKKELFQWKPPAIEAWALPLTDKDISAYIKLLKTVENLDELRFAWQDIYKVSSTEGDAELSALFTKEKDEAKLRIARQQQEQVNGDTAKIDGYITKQLKAFDQLPNESAVTGVKDSLLKELEKRTKNTAVDSGQFVIRINATHQKRIKQLKGE